MTQEIEKDVTQGEWESIARLKYVVWALLGPVLIFGLGALSYDSFSAGEYLMGAISAFLMLPGSLMYKTEIVPALTSVLRRRPHIGIYPDRVSYQGKDYPWSDVAEVRPYGAPGKWGFELWNESRERIVDVDLLTGSSNPEEGIRALLATLRTHQEHLFALMYLDSLQKHLSSSR